MPVSAASPAPLIFAKLVPEFTLKPGVEFADPKKKAFGAGTLKYKGKIFAMVTSTGHFVVKLPRDRVQELTAAGKGTPFDPGHGRLMKEWFQVETPRLPLCRSLAEDALKFASTSDKEKKK